MNSDKLLSMIAELGERKHVLFQLAADGRDFCGAAFVAQERDLKGESVETIAQAFIEDTNLHLEGNDVDFESLEETYGGIADNYIQTP